MGKVRIKPGVEFATIAPAGARILETLRRIATSLTVDLTITSGTDGEHSGPNDPHKRGEAYDIRSKDMTKSTAETVIMLLNTLLGPRFYAFHEAVGTPNQHIHCQRAKGTHYSIEDYFA